MASVVIALGSNLGDRLCNLQKAVSALCRKLDLTRVSPIYETAPMYVEDQPPFYNAAASGATDLYPLALLRALKAVEAEVGRSPADRYGPREIDIDLVAYGSIAYRFDDRGRTVLQVPHPRTPERRFVLQPLADVAPTLRLPGLPPLQEMLAATSAQADHVRIVEHAVLSLRRD